MDINFQNSKIDKNENVANSKSQMKGSFSFSEVRYDNILSNAHEHGKSENVILPCLPFKIGNLKKKTISWCSSWNDASK